MTVHPLRAYREKESLSQDDLAARLGVSRQMIGLIESGNRRVAAESVLDWESKTGVPRHALRPDIYPQGQAA